MHCFLIKHAVRFSWMSWWNLDCIVLLPFFHLAHSTMSKLLLYLLAETFYLLLPPKILLSNEHAVEFSRPTQGVWKKVEQNVSHTIVRLINFDFSQGEWEILRSPSSTSASLHDCTILSWDMETFWLAWRNNALRKIRRVRATIIHHSCKKQRWIPSLLSRFFYPSFIFSRTWLPRSHFVSVNFHFF